MFKNSTFQYFLTHKQNTLDMNERTLKAEQETVLNVDGARKKTESHSDIKKYLEKKMQELTLS